MAASSKRRTGRLQKILPGPIHFMGPEGAETMRKKILIIDDEADIRRAIWEYADELGYQAIEAANGAEGYYRLEQDSPDLVLLDLKMPGIKGLDLLRQIRKHRTDIPVIVITGVEDESLENQVRAFENCDFVKKPFNISELFEKRIKPKLG